jgi:hypothetical protein
MTNQGLCEAHHVELVSDLLRLLMALWKPQQIFAQRCRHGQLAPDAHKAIDFVIARDVLVGFDGVRKDLPHGDPEGPDVGLFRPAWLGAEALRGCPPVLTTLCQWQQSEAT